MINGILYLHGLKIPLHKIPVNYEGKISNLTMENSLRHYLNKVIKMNIISNGTNEKHVLPDKVQ